MFWLLVCTVILVVYIWQKRNYDYWERHNVPYPKPSFLVGNLGSVLTMSKHIGVQALLWYNKYKMYPYIGIYKMFNPEILINDENLIKDILIKDFMSFNENFVSFDENDEEIFKYNPFGLKGEKWKVARTKLSQLFTLSKCKLIFPLMEPAAQRLNDYIRSKGTTFDFETKLLSSQFTTENVVKCGFSMEANSFKDEKCEFREMGKKIFEPTLLTGIKFMLLQVLPSLNKFMKIQFMPEEVTNWLKRILKENIYSRNSNKLSHEDVLQLIINQSQEKHNMDENEVIGHAVSFFIEGFETSSIVLGFSFYQLSKNPEIQSRLFDEVTHVLEKHENNFTFEALQDMFYLDCFVCEIMRLYSPGLLMTKMCTKPYTMPLLPGQTEPYIVQPGTAVNIPIYAIHMDERFYPEPENFDPDRFTEDERKTRHKAVYLPFGEGPRMCLGTKFALTQIKYALANVIKDFVVERSPKLKEPIQIDPNTLMFQPKDLLYVRMKPRK